MLRIFQIWDCKTKHFPDLEMTQFWFVNYICQVCTLKILFWTCPKFWGIFLLIGYIYICSFCQIHFIADLQPLYSELYFLILSDNFVFWGKYFQNLVMFIFFIQKPVTSITQEWLVVQRCPVSSWITFFMLYSLVFNIPFHSNDLILTWSAVLQ